MKRLLLHTALIGTMAAGIFAGQGKAHAAFSPTDIKIQVNDSLVRFPDAQPFVDDGGHLQVPVRMVADQMGLRLDWSADGQTITVKLTGFNKTVVLKSGNRSASVNGVRTLMDTPAVYTDGRVYVPLRFVAESFGRILQWDAVNRITIIGTDGKYHGPAWYKPVVPSVLGTAFRYIGTDYRWGGESPDGFDCSGFVRYVYGPAGVSLPRTSRDMYAEAGEKVDFPKPGDLVFFAGSGTVDHVGIFVGGGKFISATSSGGVQLNPILTGYWANRYVGARRVI